MTVVLDRFTAVAVSLQLILSSKTVTIAEGFCASSLDGTQAGVVSTGQSSESFFLVLVVGCDIYCLLVYLRLLNPNYTHNVFKRQPVHQRC